MEATFCAEEGVVCECRGEVRYGHATNWTEWKAAGGRVECVGASFGAAPSPDGGACVCRSAGPEESLLVRQVLVLLVIAGIFATIWKILASRGRRAQVLACAFVASLVLTQLGMKQLSAPPFLFRFPACVTVLHFLTVWAVCGCYWTAMGTPEKCLPRSMGSLRRYLTAIIPIACSLPLSVIFNNQAMIYVGAGVNAVIGTLAPVATALLSRLLGRSFARASWVGVAVACAGALVITSGEVRQVSAHQASPDSGGPAQDPALMGYGFLLSFTSVFCRSIKAVLQDRLLKPRSYGGEQVASQEQADADEKGPAALEPMHVWVLQAPPCALVAALCALGSAERPGQALRQLTPGVAGMIACTCASSVLLNLSGMMTVRELGASSTQIVGKLNIVITVALAVAFLGESLPAEVLAGSCVVLVGVGIFERGEASLEALEQRVRTTLPASRKALSA